MGDGLLQTPKGLGLGQLALAHGMLRRSLIERATQQAGERVVSEAHRNQIQHLLVELDDDGDGRLTVPQVERLMAGLNRNVPPSAEESSFMRGISNWTGDARTVSFENLRRAMNFWLGYLDELRDPCSWSTEVLKKYGKTSEGRMTLAECHVFFIDLNHGGEVDAAALGELLSKSSIVEQGVLHRIELVYAVGMWYQRPPSKSHRPKSKGHADSEGHSRSKTCVLL